jgi:hypothetical protein
MKNLIQTALSDNDRTKIIDSISQLEAQVSGKLVDLTDEERVRYGSINEQNKLLVNRVFNFYKNSPALASSDVDWAEFTSDYESREFLEACIDRLSQVLRKMQSTKIMHDHDNYQDALDDYGYARYKHGAGNPDYGEKVAELRQFFARSGTAQPPNSNGGG